MIEVILEPILSIVFVGVGYVIGFLPVLIGSLGAIEPGPISRFNDRAFHRSKGMKWWHLTYLKDGKRFMPAEGVAFIGWVILASCGGLVWLLVEVFG